MRRSQNNARLSHFHWGNSGRFMWRDFMSEEHRHKRFVSRLTLSFSLIALANILLTSINGSVQALPINGKKDPEFSPFARTLEIFTPNAYSAKPKERAGRTIGLAVIPPINAKADRAERTIAELVGHIPSVNMVISVPPNDPLYLFKFLKHLKTTGRKVDFLMIAGHGLQLITDPDDYVFGIKTGPEESQWTLPKTMDVEAITKEIETLDVPGGDAVKRKALCEKLDLIHDASAAMVPGAQLVLHSCFQGNDTQTKSMKIYGTAFLGVNGGYAVGPNYVIESGVVGNIDPKGFFETAKETIMTRSFQAMRILREKRWLNPGDAFIKTQFYTGLHVPANQIKVPTCCVTPDAEKKFVGLWLTAKGAKIRVSSTGQNKLTGKFEYVVPDSPFVNKAGDYSFNSGTVKGNSMHSDTGYCYPKKGDKITPYSACRFDITISDDGKTISGSQTVYQYYDGSTTFDAGSTESPISWTRIAN